MICFFKENDKGYHGSGLEIRGLKNFETLLWEKEIDGMMLSEQIEFQNINNETHPKVFVSMEEKKDSLLLVKCSFNNKS